MFTMRGREFSLQDRRKQKPETVGHDDAKPSSSPSRGRGTERNDRDQERARGTADDETAAVSQQHLSILRRRRSDSGRQLSCLPQLRCQHRLQLKETRLCGLESDESGLAARPVSAQPLPPPHVFCRRGQAAGGA